MLQSSRLKGYQLMRKRLFRRSNSIAHAPVFHPVNITVSFWCVLKEVSDWLVLPMCRLFLAISVILKSHGNKLNNWFLSSSIIQWYIFSRNLRFFLNSPFSRSTSNESKLLNKAGGKYKKAQLTRLNNSSPKTINTTKNNRTIQNPQILRHFITKRDVAYRNDQL